MKLLNGAPSCISTWVGTIAMTVLPEAATALAVVMSITG
jgi:hypothetical protein